MSYEKIVKLACKPKNAPPKAKYLDPIIAATYSEDGAVTDVCRALAIRLREPNVTVVFKALIVLHTMIRTGNTENVLSFLATYDSLRLNNIANGHWEGYHAPEHLGGYARYLETRIKAFRELKHDAVRVQSESNRDHRVSMLEPEGREFGAATGNGRSVSRSKTISGRKLRVMSVEKGLLRETKIVQTVMDALVSTKFYLDNLEEELNVSALRMLVKDLLIMFQAVNEGVINVLEHYFEMSHVDAEEALAIYRKFCRQTEGVVEYLSIAKKLQNLLNVSIPNLKHAPVSLVNSLEEYLNDPNFEQNRLEYRANKAAADGKPFKPSIAGKIESPKPSATPAASSSKPEASTSTAPSNSHKRDLSVQDFLSSIEQEQSTMFNPNTGSPTSNYFQQQATVNPFTQANGLPGPAPQGAFIPTQMTGFPGATNPFPQAQSTSPFVQTQPTGFIQPQMTAVPTNPFPGLQPQAQPQMQQPGPFLQPQPTAAPLNAFLRPQPMGFLQPQATGSNPFRQSMVFPQATGMPSFSSPSPFSTLPSSNPFPRPGSAAALGSGPHRSGTLPTVAEVPTPGQELSQPSFGTNNAFGNNIQRPASTPIKSSSAPVGGIATHTTGSRNPFGIPQSSVPPVPALPKAPTLQQLATGAGWSSFSVSSPASPANGAASAATQTNPITVQPTGGGLIGSVASSFVGNNNTSPPANNGLPGAFLGRPASPFGSNASQTSTLAPQTTSSSAWSSAFGGSSAFSTMGGAPSTTASSPPPSIAPLSAQPTGLGGSSVRPFKPSSSFGATLLENLPPVGENGSSQNQTGMPSLTTGIAALGLNGSNTSNGLSNPTSTSPPPFARPGFGGGANPTGSGFGLLQPQQTGGNPFRTSMAFGNNFSVGNSSVPPVPNFGSAFTGASNANPGSGTGLGVGSRTTGASLFGLNGVGSGGSSNGGPTGLLGGPSSANTQLPAFTGLGGGAFGGSQFNSMFGSDFAPSNQAAAGGKPNGQTASLI